MNCHNMRIKEEEEPMEVSDLVHNGQITKESAQLAVMGSHQMFSGEAEDQMHASNKMGEQLCPGATISDQCLNDLKSEDRFYPAGFQTGPGMADSLVSGAAMFQLKVKTEDCGDQSEAKMEEQLLFKRKSPEQPFFAAKIEDVFPAGAKMEERLLFGSKMENSMMDHVFTGAKKERQLFVGTKIEEQFTSGPKMADQCLRAVLWQDMSVNLASTLLHQLSGKETDWNSCNSERWHFHQNTIE